MPSNPQVPQNPQDPQDPQNTPIPKPGDLIVNITPVADVLFDLPEGETRGMLTEKPGFAEVVLEIIANQAAWGDKAGMTAGDFADLQSANDAVSRLAAFLPAARKVVELLEESYAKYDDQRQRIIHALAVGVERRAKTRDDGGTLLAKYQKTREYRSATALKGVKTRRRNQKAAEAAEAEAKPTSQPTS